MRRQVPAAEAKIIARGIAARLGIDFDWAFERDKQGRLLMNHSRTEARRAIIDAMRKTLVCPRPMSANEIGSGLGIDKVRIYNQLRAIALKQRERVR